jgi:transposase
VIDGDPVPAVPSCILDPVRDQFLALLPARPVTHPLGCHRPRVPDAVVFDKLVAALVFGGGYERHADASCSATTMRRRRREWSELGVLDRLWTIALSAYQAVVGLDLADLPLDGCLTKAPAGGEVAGPSPVDRAKHGLKRSMVTDGAGVPLGVVAAPANVRDDALLDATLATLTRVEPLDYRPVVHLDAGYNYQPCRDTLARHELLAAIAQRGVPAPIQNGKRWVVERTHAWLNAFGRIRRCTERRKNAVEFYLTLACILVTVRNLISRAWYTHRWPTRPRNPRLR